MNAIHRISNSAIEETTQCHPRYNSPCTLNAKLLEIGRRDKTLVAGKGIRIEEGATDDGDDDDTQSSTKDLRTIPHDGATRHRTQIGNHLSDRDRVGREVVLIREHGWVEVLRPMRLQQLDKYPSTRYKI